MPSTGSQTPTLDPSSTGAADMLQAMPDSNVADSGASADAPPNPPSSRAAMTVAPTDDRPMPERIGPYKLLEVVGEGGFGTVWIADQIEPVKRRVAFKIIKAGMDSRAIVARFEQERQALALMDHPNIARVFDAGTAPDGRPYFVMEFVAGESITSYCDRMRLNVKQRLELFVSVCEAVQHAHHKGIIHRDLKPGNVLVSQVAGSNGVVKVIDFGVAKAVSHVLTDKTIFTEFGQILGTPEYMSPEQAEMGALDIDTRTDVYALGVMLYELLAGALPFEPKELRSKGYNEIQRIIREVEPPRPSTKLRSMGAAPSEEIAKRRQSKIGELEGQLRRELEWIPLKAMRKERDERYNTPIAMAEDIKNHLAGRPLVAGPVSVMYRTKKFVVRNRWGVGAAAMIAISIVAGTILSTVGFVRAAHARDVARHEASRLRQLAIYNTSLLAQANPTAGERPDVTVRELLDDAANQLDRGAQKGNPDIEAALRRSLGETYQSLSMSQPAEQQWQKAVDLESQYSSGIESPNQAAALNGLGLAKISTQKFDDAEKVLNQALSIEHEQLAASDPQIGDTLSNLGWLAQSRGDLAKAETNYRDALKVFNQQPENTVSIADAMTNLATVRHQLGDENESLDLAQKGLALRRERFGDHHIDVWNSLIAIAQAQEFTGNLSGAERTRREAMSIASNLLDEKNRKTVTSIDQLARTLWLIGGNSLDEAQKLETHAMELATSIDGTDCAANARGLDLLACIARDRGQFDQSVDLFRKSLAMRQKINSPASDVAGEMSQLADALTRAGQAKEAIALATKALDIRKDLFKDHPTHWAIMTTSSVLGGAYAASGDFKTAEPMLLDSYKGLEKSNVMAGRIRTDAAGRLASLYEKWGKPEQAQQWKQLAETKIQRS